MAQVRIRNTHQMQTLARTIACQYGVKVKVQGNDAKTDGKTIYLPNIEVADQESIDRLFALLMHETGHVKFSKYGVSIDSNLHNTFSNAIEDVRIESKMERKYKPLKKVFRVHSEGCEKRIYERMQINPIPQDDNIRLSVAIMDVLHKYREISDFSEDPNTYTILGVISDLLKHLPKSTEESINRARKIISRLSTDKQGLKNKKGDNSERINEINKELPFAEEHAKEANGNFEKARQKLIESGVNPDCIDPEEAQFNKKVEKYKEAQAEAFKINMKVSKMNKEKEELEGENESIDKMFDMPDKDLEEIKEQVEKPFENTEEVREFNERLQKEISEIVKKMWEEDRKNENLSDKVKQEIGDTSVDKYVPYGTEKDKVKVMKQGNQIRYNNFRAEVAPLINKLYRYLSEKLKANVKKREIRFKQDGKLDSKSFIRAAHGATDVFKKKGIKKSYDSAVSLVIDCSGSMGCGTSVEATKASIAIGEALLRLNIPFEVVGFKTGYTSCPDTWRKGRSGNITLAFDVFKSFDQFNLVNLEKIASAPNGQTVLGESLMWGAERLGKRLESRKVIFFITDGEPSCPGCSVKTLERDMTVKVKQIECAGIDVVGVGICSSDISKYFREFVEIKDASELPDKLTDKMKERLSKVVGLRN